MPRKIGNASARLLAAAIAIVAAAAGVTGIAADARAFPAMVPDTVETTLGSATGRRVIPVQSFRREREYFGDYMATCRVDGACDAIIFTNTPTASGQSFSSTLTLKRAHGPGTAWILTFAGAFDGPVKGTPINVSIDGQRWFLLAEQGYSDIGGHDFFISPVNQQIIGPMRRGRSMAITQTISNGSRQTVTYSLKGIVAAMKWIDRKQGRGVRTLMMGTPFSIEEAVPR